jgi:hypothetical protein
MNIPLPRLTRRHWLKTMGAMFAGTTVPLSHAISSLAEEPATWAIRDIGSRRELFVGDRYRLYYRCQPPGGSEDGDEHQVTCYAESPDGVTWTKPNLGLFEFQGSKENIYSIRFTNRENSP